MEDFVKGLVAALMYVQRLTVGKRIPFVSLEGRSSRRIRTFNGQVYEDRIGIFFDQSRALPLPASKDPYELMFTLAGFGDQCSPYLTRGYSAFERFLNAFDLYFSLETSCTLLPQAREAGESASST